MYYYVHSLKSCTTPSQSSTSYRSYIWCDNLTRHGPDCRNPYFHVLLSGPYSQFYLVNQSILEFPLHLGTTVISQWLTSIRHQRQIMMIWTNPPNTTTLVPGNPGAPIVPVNPMLPFGPGAPSLPAMPVCPTSPCDPGGPMIQNKYGHRCTHATAK